MPVNINKIQEIAKMVDEIGFDRTVEQLGIKAESVARYLRYAGDDEIVIENVKLAKQKQRAQDLNRISNKSFREHSRLDNSLQEFNQELIKVIQKYPFKGKAHKTNKLSNAVGVVHFSDLHLNELVELYFNKFDFTEASRRLKLFVDETKFYFKARKIKNILLADTGDKLNSDRRLDELLSQATNRANATALSVHLLKQVIEDLAQDINVKIACVTGNESRTKEEYGWTNILATDNYDFTIFSMLRYLFMGDKRISFILGDPTELVVEVAGHNWLLLHGHNSQIQKNVEQSVQSIIGKYATRGQIIRYVIFGHLHSARLGDYYSRSSSLVGSNDFSDKGLELAGRASQNIYIAKENENIDSIKIDLQSTNGISGYNIIKELEAYNAKSASKLHDSKTIFQIMV